MCMQRTFMWGIDCFVNELLDGGARGFCDCVCNDKCYCEDLAAVGECECSGIPPELKDKMKSCSMQYIPDDEEFRCTSRPMLRFLQIYNPFCHPRKWAVTSSACVDEWKCKCHQYWLTNVSCSPTHHTMRLLDRVEHRLGPINTWPTYIIGFPFLWTFQHLSLWKN
jgi:hypothetical protein